MTWETDTAVPALQASIVRCIQVCKEAGLYTDSFMALRKLGEVEPNCPGLFEQTQRAAELCLGSERAQRKQAQVGTALCKSAFSIVEQSPVLTLTFIYMCRTQSTRRPSTVQMPAC